MATPEKAPRSAAEARWQQWRPHLRRFLPIVGLNHAVTLAIIIAISVIIGIGAGFGVVPATIAGLWMQVNLAPVRMSGVTLGFAPLLPALLIVWVHSRRVTGALGNSVSIRGLRVLTTVGLLLPIFITVVAWLMLWDAAKVYSVRPPNLFGAIISTALVNGAVLVMGMGARVWRALLLRRGFPTWPVEAFRLARRFLLWMCVAGLAVAIASMIANFNAVKNSYDITSNFSGTLGLTLLSLLYLPNLAVASAAVLLGGEFHIGRGVFSLFAANNVNLPPIPIAAAIPNHELSWGPLALIVPAVVSVVVVYRYMQQREFVESPAYLALTAGVAVAFIGFCVCWLAGGELGVFGETGALPWMFALEAAAWLLVPALVMMLWAARSGSRVVEDIPDAQLRSDARGASGLEKTDEGVPKKSAWKQGAEKQQKEQAAVKQEPDERGAEKQVGEKQQKEQEPDKRGAEKQVGEKQQEEQEPDKRGTEKQAGEKQQKEQAAEGQEPDERGTEKQGAEKQQKEQATEEQEPDERGTEKQGAEKQQKEQRAEKQEPDEQKLEKQPVEKRVAKETGTARKVTKDDGGGESAHVIKREK
ncbi:DUF6350 family protein [Corynebacterium sp. HMSC28B08]|uniref:cell division protein PerM n=1 Tax=Corynebacterium sp. HMSC28B08 TaxID=1581066 RepID=UPI0008A5C1C7|nr:DUF6350 family protein [Corynebacterium sp. HMSC28B08]